MKFILPLICCLCIQSAVYSQNTGKSAIKDAITVRRTYINISAVSGEVIDSINKIENRAERSISLKKDISQEDFDKLCKNLKWIKKLDIPYLSNITSFKSISNLTALEEISITNRRYNNSDRVFFDMKLLSKAENLKKLKLSGAAFTNIESLTSYNNIEFLSLSSLDLEQLAFLKGMSNLKKLFISGGNKRLMDYSPIGSLQGLVTLDISQNANANTNSLKSIGTINSLEEMSMFGISELSSLDFLNGNANLTSVTIKACHKLTDIKGLKEKTKLKKINLRDNTNLVDITPLQSVTNLESLRLDQTAVEDLTPLTDLTKLDFIDLSNTKVTSVTSLAKAPVLRGLILKNTGVSDISPLANKKTLKQLNILNTNVEDVSSLRGSHEYLSLYVNSNFDQNQLDELKKAIPKLKVRK